MEAKRKKVLEEFFKSLLKNGNSIDLKLSFKKIKYLDNYYKENFDKYNNDDQGYLEFLNSNLKFKEGLSLSLAAENEVHKQFLLGRGLQPAILTECFLAQTIAELFKLNSIIINKPGFSVPSEITNLLLAAKGQHDSNFRYLYYDKDNMNIVLTQNGDSSSIDAFFIKNKILIRIEFKEKASRFNERDISKYDDDGKLLPAEDFRRLYPYYSLIIDDFNSRHSLFELLGGNIKLGQLLDPQIVKEIFGLENKTKEIDLYIFAGSTKLYPVLYDYIPDYVSIANSELRTTGKNSKKVYTFKYLDEILKSIGAVYKNNYIMVKKEKMEPRKARQHDKKISGYKLNNLLFVPIKLIKEDGDFYIFEKKDIFQINPTISLHLDLLENEDYSKQLTFFK